MTRETQQPTAEPTTIERVGDRVLTECDACGESALVEFQWEYCGDCDDVARDHAEERLEELSELSTSELAAEERGQVSHERLFVGVKPGAVCYADREHETGGDYTPIARLVYDTLELKWTGHQVPNEVVEEIREDASKLQARAGELFRISTSGQTVRLGAAHFPESD